MLSYHNDPAVKEKYQKRFAAHREADEVIQGTGYESGKGCFVGCTLDKYDHAAFETELGWPEWLAWVADKIFEGLEVDEAPQFGTDLLEAVPVGVDLDIVKLKLSVMRIDYILEEIESDELWVDRISAVQLVKENLCRAIEGDMDALREHIGFPYDPRLTYAWWAITDTLRYAVKEAPCMSIMFSETAFPKSNIFQKERDNLLQILRELKQEN